MAFDNLLPGRDRRDDCVRVIGITGRGEEAFVASAAATRVVPVNRIAAAGNLRAEPLLLARAPSPL